MRQGARDGEAVGEENGMEDQGTFVRPPLPLNRISLLALFVLIESAAEKALAKLKI